MNTRPPIAEARPGHRQTVRAWRLGEALAQRPADDPAERTLVLATALLEDAMRENASDIHLDPAGERYEVRFRIDGALVDTMELPHETGLHLLRSFKSHADLDPAFALRPQDGRAALPLPLNARQGLTYAEGVKGLLRLDPDVLVLGEMRDALSARAALDAADSGHVFLSKLHARDAAGTLSVLRRFGFADHEIAASVDLLVAQRLVRRLCSACRRPEPPTADEAQWLRLCGQPVPTKTWRAAGCEKCGGTGYRGRIGVFEIHRLREEDADLILAHADEHTLRRHLRRRGALSLLEDDLAKVAEGITSIAEFQAVGGMGFFARDRAPAAPAQS